MSQHWDTLSAKQIDNFLHVRLFLTSAFLQTLPVPAILLQHAVLRHGPHLHQNLHPSSLSPPLRHLANTIRLYILPGIVIIYGIWLLFCSIFTCVPIARFWDKSVPGHCVRETPMWFTNASLNIATDFAILVLPQRTIYALSLPKGQKIIYAVCLRWDFCMLPQFYDAPSNPLLPRGEFY
jgi:hypothetical protein